MSNWGQKLQGFGETLAGRGSQWQNAQSIQQRTDMMAQDQQQEARLLANIQDTARMATLFQMGDINGVSNILTQRIEALQKSGGDPSHSMATLQMLQENPEAAFRDVMAGYNTFAQMGYLTPQTSAQGWGSVITGEDGRRYGIPESNPNAGYQPIPMPDGVTARSGGTEVNVNMGGDNEFTKSLGKAYGTEMSQISEDARNAATQNRRLDAIAGIDINTGWGTDFQRKFASMVDGSLGEGTSKKYGILQTNSLPGLEVYQAIAQDFVNQKLNAAKGPQTEGDAQRAIETVMGLTKADEANNFLISLMREENARAQDKRKFYQEYMQKNGRSMDSFEEAGFAWDARLSTIPMVGRVTDKQTNLPILYSQFVKKAKARNKGASMEDIDTAWRQLNGIEP